MERRNLYLKVSAPLLPTPDSTTPLNGRPPTLLTSNLSFTLFSASSTAGGLHNTTRSSLAP